MKTIHCNPRARLISGLVRSQDAHIGMRILPSFLFAVSLLLSACGVVVSDKPLSSPRYSDRDPRLEGLWRVEEQKNVSYFYVVYGPDAHGSILSFGRDEKGLDAISCDFFVTRTLKHSYMNLSLEGEARRGHVKRITTKQYMFAEYHFSGSGKLVTSLIGGESFSRAIKQGKLHGKTDKYSNSTLHDTSERVLTFIETSRPKDVLEKSPTTATRIGKPCSKQ